jgi:hypothetical protein
VPAVLPGDPPKLTINGVAFTGEGKLVRKATGYEQEKLKPRSPTSGSRAARAEPPTPIGAYRLPTDFSDEAQNEASKYRIKLFPRNGA